MIAVQCREVRAAALQYVRKISDFAKPSAANEQTNAALKDREVEAAKARARSVRRFRQSFDVHAGDEPFR